MNQGEQPKREAQYQRQYHQFIAWLLHLLPICVRDQTGDCSINYVYIETTQCDHFPSSDPILNKASLLDNTTTDSAYGYSLIVFSSSN